ncbi:glycosyltransferase family 2 protein [Sphingomonas flavalba]|uniref:glycosyltransferase family 2 protein n=1 Tax=Sphingomonas flavalba TaxID=2559804 RepID=UPI0039DFC60C
MISTPDQQAQCALSIIIVSYGTRDDTLACLASLYAHPPAVPFEVILFDNASPDDSVAAIAAAYPQVRLIASPDNLGFGAGNNAAAKLATGDRILLLNPDTIVLPHTFAGLIDFATRTPDRGIWGGRTLFGDGTLNPTSCWASLSLWSLFVIMSGLTRAFPYTRLFDPEIYGGWQRDTESDVDIVTGCFLLIDRTLWERLGGFDPTFFMYAEEADLNLRARRMGARPGISPAAELIHLGGRSETSRPDKMVKIMRGRTTLMRKHWSPVAYRLGLAMCWAWALSRMLGSHIMPGRRDNPQSARADRAAVWQRRREWLAGYPDVARTTD